MLLLLFTGAIIWESRKLVSLINHNTACTALIQWNISFGGKLHRVCRFAPWSVRNGPIPYFYFPYISRIWFYMLTFVIVWRFLPNSMMIGWISLTWGHFLLNYVILPRVPLYLIKQNICIFIFIVRVLHKAHIKSYFHVLLIRLSWHSAILLIIISLIPDFDYRFTHIYDILVSNANISNAKLHVWRDNIFHFRLTNGCSWEIAEVLTQKMSRPKGSFPNFWC